MLNRNIGCIEIEETLNLKNIQILLNRNIGCIEIRYGNGYRQRQRKLNRNIGCIEILPLDKSQESSPS